MNEKLATIYFIKKKPYFLHKVFYDWEKVKEFKTKYPNIRYYYTKLS